MDDPFSNMLTYLLTYLFLLLVISITYICVNCDVCREREHDENEEDGIKTITYDEYVNAGIPDALLQGLGFAEGLGCAESLSEESMNTEDAADAVVGTESAADVGGASRPHEQPAISPVPLVPVSLMQLLGSHVESVVKNSVTSEMSSKASSVDGSPAANNVVSNTPSILNLVDRDGNILPALAAASSNCLVANGLTYVDQNGRVVGRAGVSESAVRLVDSNGRVVEPSSGLGALPGSVSISEPNAVTEPAAKTCPISLPSHSAVSQSTVKQRQSSSARQSNIENCGRSKSEPFISLSMNHYFNL